MSLRITQGSLFALARQNIANSLQHFTRLQDSISTGRRVNRPSDDPAATLRIIPLNNDLRNLDQLTDNIALARETLNTGAAALEDASSLMQRLRELAMQAANGAISEADRRSIGAEVEQLLNQMVSIANSKRGDQFLFGGTSSDRQPFEIVTDGGGTRVVYRGNHRKLDIEVAPGIKTSLNLPGDSIFQQRSRGPVAFTGGGTGARPTGSGDTAVGFQNLSVAFNGLHTDAPSTVFAGSGTTTALGRLDYQFTAAPPTLSVGGGPAVPIPASDADFMTADGRTINLTVTGVPAALSGTFTAKAGLSTDGGASVTDVADFSATSVAIRNSFDGTVLNVDVSALSRTGTELVKHTGTFDAFTVLVTLRDLLRNEDGLEPNVVQERIANLLAEVDEAHEGVLDGLRELGFRSSSMELLGGRVESLKVSRSESLSLVQDTDIAESILQLQRQDITYQAALQVSARMIQTSLQGLLR
ncbi:MAG: hypothetical protein Fur0037_05670 [Planctomycetota bacterium]